MKIVLIIPTLKQGGAERVISELANIWAKQGLNIHLVLLAGGEQFYMLDNNVKVYDLGFVNNGHIQKKLQEVKVFFQLRAILKSIKPDFVFKFYDKI